ncbi:MAG: helix-turn-helix transcriptional regulator [Opitutales bacterium]
MIAASLARTAGAEFGVVGTYCSSQKQFLATSVGRLSTDGDIKAETAVKLVRFTLDTVVAGGLLRTVKADGPDLPISTTLDIGQEEPVLWVTSRRCLVGMWQRPDGVFPFAAILRKEDGGSWPRWQKELVRMSLILERDNPEAGGGAKAPKSLQDFVLDRLALAMMVVDPDCGLKFLNEAATDFLATSQHLAKMNGRLAAATPDAQKSLRAAIHAATVDSPRTSSVVKIAGTEVFQPEIVTVTPLHMDSPLALIIAAGRPQDPALIDLMLKEIGLTPSEKRVMRLLVQGASLENAASIANVKLTTARGYLRKAFEKTGTHRQSDLIALVMKQIAPLQSLPKGKQVEAKLETRRRPARGEATGAFRNPL